MSPRCFELVVTPPRAQKSPYAALTKNGSFHLFHMTSCKLWCNFCLRSEAHLDAPPSSNIIKTQSTWQWFIYLFIYFLSEMIIFFSDLLLGLLSGKKQQPFNKSTHKPVIILSHNRHSAVSLGQALQSFLSPIFIIQLSLIIAQSVVATRVSWCCHTGDMLEIIVAATIIWHETHTALSLHHLIIPSISCILFF